MSTETCRSDRLPRRSITLDLSNADQLQVTGAVILQAGAAATNLVLTNLASLNSSLSGGERFILVDNEGSGPISGTLTVGGTALAEGDLVPGISFDDDGTTRGARITYAGGDGNDVAIVVDGDFSPYRSWLTLSMEWITNLTIETADVDGVTHLVTKRHD